MDTDRNLLLGILALQAGLIDGPQLIEACTVWASRKSVPLVDLLLERGWLLSEDRAHLDYLLERRLRQPGGVAASVSTLPEAIRQSLASVGDPDLARKVEPPATVQRVPSGTRRYTLLQPHALGGIGQVWLARDHVLQRDVALKALRPEHVGEPIQRARFLREARITGQLEHPGVVPVYELAEWPGSGEPFYAMRFVRGRTLAEAARSFHERRRAGQSDRVELLGLLNAFVVACNTVAYAHSRGVIHRDLKGQNVVLGDFGEVVLLDWGLAKELKADGGASLSGVEEEVDSKLRGPPPSETPTGVHTLHGQALGTPGFMSPEQAAGQVDRIDRRTDVYGLAAILYEILTGRPPFEGEGWQAVLVKVQSDEPLPPSQLWPEVPAILEAACLRGLSKDAEARHASAAELAGEVQQWLAELAQRRRTEQERERFFALSLDLLGILDHDGRLTQANPAWETTLGWPRAELMRLTLQELVHPDDVEPTLAHRERVLKGEPVVAFENRMLCKGGGHRWLSWNATPLGAEQLAYIVGRDVTERKVVEEELRLLADSIPQIVWSAGPDGKVDYFNQRGYEYRGEAAEEVYEDGWKEVLHPEDLPRCVPVWEEAVRKGETYTVEFRLRRHDGVYRWHLSRAIPVRDLSGKVVKWFGTCTDIDDQRQAGE